MSYWNKHPLRFKYLFLSLGIFLFLVATRNFVGIATTVDDQNFYSDPPSRLYINSSIVKLDSKINNYNDIIHQPGSLLFSINNENFYTKIEVSEYLKKFSSQDTLKFKIFTPTPRDSSVGIIDSFDVLARNIPKNFISYLASAAIVQSVVKDGVSDLAGIKSGDIITSINDKSFDSAEDAHRIMASSSKGSFIKYGILRENEQFSLKVKLAKFKLPLDSLIIFIMGLTIALTGLWIGVFRPKIIAARLTGLGFLLIGILFTFFTTLQLIALVGSGLESRINYFIMIACLYFGTSTLMHSLTYFPFITQSLVTREKYFRLSYYLSAFTLLLLLFEISSPLFTQNEYLNRLFFSNIIISAMIIFFTIWYTYLFIRFKPKKEEKLQKGGKLIRLSYSLLILVFIISIITASTGGAPSWLNYAFFILPISYTITIGKHNLLDNLIKLSKNIQYSFLSVGVNIFIYSIMALVIILLSTVEFPIPNIHFNGRNIEILDKPLSDRSTFIYGKILFLIFSGVIVIAFIKTKNKLIGFLNERFYIVKFDYKTALSKLNEVLQNNSTNEKLAPSITEKLIEILKLKRAGIIIFENNNKISEQYYHGLEDRKLKEYSIAIEDKLIKSIEDFSGNVLVDYLSNDIKNIYIECRFKFIIPIRSKDKLLGVLFIGEKKSEASFDSEDLAFLSSLARQISVALENASLYSDLAKQERIKQELDIARRIQLSSLPQEVPNIRGLEISGFSIPALEVGGDFYDFYENEENDFKLTTVVGDVSGKGTSAALYMSKAQGIMQSLQEFDLDPQELLTKTNSLIYNYLEKGAFITSSALQFDSLAKVAKISRAGHLPLYYFNSAIKKVEKIIPKGLVLGMNKGELFYRNLEQKSINYNAGDFFILVTDGILEARNSQNEEFEEERFINIIESASNTSAENMKDLILKKVTDYTGREDQFDDLTIVVVKAV